VRLGGFVIHGSDVLALPRCVESLCQVSDEVLLVDSSAHGASCVLANRWGVRRLEMTWEGYGAARAAAARSLAHCDYLFFLDADEHLELASISWLRAWKRSGDRRPAYTLQIRDWALLPPRRFLFRQEHHVRLLRADRAVWHAGMIVHERLSRAGAARAPAAIEHAFATDFGEREQKNERYALLWALRACAEGARARKSPALQRAWHFIRGAFWQGAAFRGGWPALRLAWSVARYHARKYALLAQVKRGAYAPALTALKAGRRREMFAYMD
jgi:hypothetical protein